MSKCSAWRPVLDKVRKKLATWKLKTLSRAGRLTLIKSMLNSLPIYFMSLFKMPKWIAKEIVKLQRSFFWGDSRNDWMATPTVKWALIELPKNLGGLSVGNIMYKNFVILFKWWWRVSVCDNTLWKRILMSVHNFKGQKASSDNFRNAKEGLWAQLTNDEVETVKIRSIVEEGMVLKVGSGHSIIFWHDKWCDVGPLKEVFPRLFSISTQKNFYINHMGYWRDGSWNWSLWWRRVLYERELADLANLETIISHKMPQSTRSDGIT